MNPFFWLEIRIRAREKRLWIIALFFLLSVFLFGGGILAIAVLSSSSDVVPGALGLGISSTVLFWHGALMIVLAPLASAGRIAQEREQRTLPALINTPVNTWSIVRGKLWGSWTFILWLSALILPFLSIGLVWGGIEFWRMAACMALNILVSLMFATVALGFSGLFGRSLTAYLVSGTFMIAWMVLLPILGSIGLALSDIVEWEGLQTFISYLCLFNHPFFPIVMLVSEAYELEPALTTFRIAYAIAVWCVVGGIGLLLANRGLKREVY